MKSTILSLLALCICTEAVSARILINEIHRRTPATTSSMVDREESADENAEFVELRGNSAEYCTHDGTITGLPLSLVFLKTNGAKSYGRVQEVWRLVTPGGNGARDEPFQLGSNGLLLLGDRYPFPEEFPWAGFKNQATNVADPVGCKAEDLLDEKGLTCLLVVNYTYPATNETIVPPAVEADKPDFDVDDDGILDWKENPVPNGTSDKTGLPIQGIPTAPWTHYAANSEFVDSLGYNGDKEGTVNPENRLTYAAGTLSTGASSGIGAGLLHPWNLSRYGNHTTPNSSVGWYGGEVAGTDTNTGTAYTAARFNKSTGTIQTWSGAVTPGVANLSATPTAPIFRITEVNLNPPGSPGISYNALNQSNPNDGNFEYIEIANTITTTGVDKSASLAGHSLILLNSTGEVEEHWDLSKFATGSNGLLLIGDRYPEGFCPFSKIVDPGTTFGDPSAPSVKEGDDTVYTSLNQGDIGSNNGMTLVLAKNSDAIKYTETGTNDQALKDYDTNNDGILQAANLADAVGRGVTGNILDAICTAELNPLNGQLVANRGGYATTSSLNLVVGGRNYNPDNFSRKMSSAVAFNAIVGTANWRYGNLGASNDPNSVFYRVGYHVDAVLRGQATPGKLNVFAAIPAPAVGSLMLNEVHVNPGGTEDAAEYVELLSTAPYQPMANCWLVIASTSPASLGTVRKVIDLRNMNTGANRLAVFGDGVEEASFAFADSLSPRTLRDDPQSYAATGVLSTDEGLRFSVNSLDNEGAAVFLVVHASAPTTAGTDLDPENDGQFTKPWTTTLDAVSTGASLGEALKAAGTALAPTALHNVSRYPGNTTALQAAAWFGGSLTVGGPATVTYAASYFGNFQGAASPGRHNPTAPVMDANVVLLNEVHVNPPGGDNNKEFIELLATNGGAVSLNNYSLLFVDNEGNDTGTVQKVIDLDGTATGSNGLALLGAGYATALPWIGTASPASGTQVVSPDGLAVDDIARATDNGAFCVVLVRNFRGRLGDDLDIGTNVAHSAADDHAFDLPTYWTALVDGLAFRGFVPFDTVDPNITTDDIPAHHSGFGFLGLPDLTTPGYTPDTVARYEGEHSLTKDAWYGGDLFGSASLTVAYDTVELFPNGLTSAKTTPGQANLGTTPDDSDLDGDGVNYLLELALGMNPSEPDQPKLPQPGYGLASGSAQPQPLYYMTRPTGGLAGVTYSYQGSFDLQNWSVPLALKATTDLGNGMERLTFGIDPVALPLLPLYQHLFFRTKVER